MSVKIPLYTLSNDGEAFQTGEEFERFISKTYKRDFDSVTLILKKITPKQAISLVSRDDQYFQSAARNLSYRSLAFLVKLKAAERFSEKFNKNSAILSTFIQGMQAQKNNNELIKKVMKVLYQFNKGGLMRIIIKSCDPELLKAFKACENLEEPEKKSIFPFKTC